MDTIASTFRARRIALGLDQEQVASLAGVSRGTVKALESGEGRITLKNVRRLLTVVGLDVAAREAMKRPTLDELSERYGTEETTPPRKRASRKRRTAS
jgi:transcriptional regulator with XRE-family HTH domain